MTNSFKQRSRSSENNENALNPARYLPDGKLNVAGRWKSPGPGKYSLPSCTGFIKHDPTLNKRPAYTIANKWRDLTKDSCSPGPIYYPDSQVTNAGLTKSPSYTLSGRSKEYSLWIGPGPGQYHPESAVDPSKFRGPAYTIGRKHKHLEIPTHPVGPNKYNLPNTIGNRNLMSNIVTAPKFSLSSRNKFMSITYGMDNSPNKLYNYDIDKIKTKSPKWTIAGRNYIPEMSNRIPGPNQYNTEKCKVVYRSPPSITMGIRHSELCSTGLPSHFESD